MMSILSGKDIYRLAFKCFNHSNRYYKEVMIRSGDHLIMRRFGDAIANRRIKTNSNEYHCLQIVKKYDYENFLATLHIRCNELRRTAFALRALNVELAQVRDLTKSDQLAQIRFQFWSDIIDGIYCNKESSDEMTNENRNYKNRLHFPVAGELQEVLSQSELSKHWLRKMISVRREAAYLSQFPFQTMEEMEKYCESCFTSLYYLLDEKTIELSTDKSPSRRIALDHIASHLGKAQGLTNILRGVKHNAISRRCYIPNDILRKSKCTHEDFLRGNINKSVCDAVFEIASLANSHLEHSIDLLRNLKGNRDDKLIFLPHVSLKHYLGLLQQCDFNIFHRKLYRKNGYLPLALWWKSKFI